MTAEAVEYAATSSTSGYISADLIFADAELALVLNNVPVVTRARRRYNCICWADLHPSFRKVVCTPIAWDDEREFFKLRIHSVALVVERFV